MLRSRCRCLIHILEALFLDRCSQRLGHCRIRGEKGRCAEDFWRSGTNKGTVGGILMVFRLQKYQGKAPSCFRYRILATLSLPCVCSFNVHLTLFSRKR